MPTSEILERAIQSVGGAFRFGKGIMGKSAVVVSIVLVVVAIALIKLPRPTNISVLVLVGLAVAAFLVWFFAVLQYAYKHPETVLLEGAEWTAWKRFEASCKNAGGPREAELTHDPRASLRSPGGRVTEQDK